MRRTSTRLVLAGVLMTGGGGDVLATKRQTTDPCSVARALPAHIRTSDCGMAGSIVEGLEVSPTLRLVVDRVATLKGIVHVHVRPGLQRAFSGALMHLVTPLDDYRVLHVRVAPESSIRRVSILAHELQHAIEVLESDAVTEAEIDSLFERIGTPSGVGMTETKAAIETERKVLREMSARQRGREGRRGHGRRL